MRAPAELGRLAALADEAVDRPGVDELARLLRRRRPTWVSRSAMWIDLDAEVAAPAPPSPPRVAGAAVSTPVSRAMSSSACLTKCETRPGIGAMRQHRGRAAAEPAQRQRALAQRVVGALRRRQRRIGIAAGPGLDAGVEIERAALLAQRDQRHRRHVDRQVQQEIAGAEQRRQHVAKVVAGQPAATVNATPYLRRDLAPALVGGDDGDRSRGMSIWRRISGRTPWPMLPKPSMTRRPAESDMFHRCGLLRDRRLSGGESVASGAVRCWLAAGARRVARPRPGAPGRSH